MDINPLKFLPLAQKGRTRDMLAELGRMALSVGRDKLALLISDTFQKEPVEIPLCLEGREQPPPPVQPVASQGEEEDEIKLPYFLSEEKG
jgi:hypothetical protein